MTVLLCGEIQECEKIFELLYSVTDISQKIIVDDYELIHEYVIDSKPCMAIVTDNGAKGMESVIRIRESDKDIPILWFSDDGNFAIQSYRMKCSYFTTKPITHEKMQKALSLIR